MPTDLPQEQLAREEVQAGSARAWAQLAPDAGPEWPLVHATVVQGEVLLPQGEALAASFGVSAGSHEAVAQRTH